MRKFKLVRDCHSFNWLFSYLEHRVCLHGLVAVASLDNKHFSEAKAYSVWEKNLLRIRLPRFDKF